MVSISHYQAIELAKDKTMFKLIIDKAVQKLKIKRKHYQQLKDMAPELIINKQTIMPRKSILAILSCDTKEIAHDIDLHTIFKGIFPFLGAMIIGLIILILFPDIVLFLPGLVR